MAGLQLGRSRTWGFLALLVLVLVNSALLAHMLLGSGGPQPYAVGARVAATGPGEAVTGPSPAEVPEASVALRPAALPDPAVLAVYGDGYAAGNELGGVGLTGWPALVAQQTETELALHAVRQAGYATEGASGQDFIDLIQANPVPDAAVTVVFGSRNDVQADPADISARVSEALVAVRTHAPQTSLLVIGPAWSNADVPPNILALRDAVLAVAQDAGATFVDPVAQGWFTESSGLIAADGISPTDEGHAYMADRIAPAVATALAAA